MGASLIPLGAALIAVAGTLLTLVFQRRKVRAETNSEVADAAETNVAAALSLITPLRDRIAQLESDMASMREAIEIARDRITILEAQVEEERKVVDILTGGVAALEGQVRSLGETPVFLYRRNKNMEESP